MRRLTITWSPFARLITLILEAVTQFVSLPGIISPTQRTLSWSHHIVDALQGLPSFGLRHSNLPSVLLSPHSHTDRQKRTQLSRQYSVDNRACTLRHCYYGRDARGGDSPPFKRDGTPDTVPRYHKLALCGKDKCLGDWLLLVSMAQCGGFCRHGKTDTPL